MKKCFFSVLLNILILSLVWGQEQPKDNELFFKNIQQNSVFIELGGLGGIVSVNYERCVPAGNKTGFGFRIGAGTAGPADTANISITYVIMLETNFLYGKNKHFLETGIGFANAFVIDETEQWVTIKLGYRYQTKKGLVFKIAPMYIINYKALLGNDDVFDGIWLGVALGYSF